MSRIFDALQRSVGEKAGNDSATLPLGQDLLRHAERQVASDWEATTSVQDPGPATDKSASGIPAFLPHTPSAAEISLPVALDAPTTDEQVELFKYLKPLSTSVTPASHLASLTDKDSPTAEALRLLALRLRDLRRRRPLKKVLITSTIPREGKSTIAANLACTLARRVDQKVLIIEGDLRLPSVMKIFGAAMPPGLCELLRDEGNLWEHVYRIEEANLWVLPAGTPPSNPLEILQSQKLPLYLDQLAASFDWIIIDSPPILPLADTSVWMRLAEGALLVTRQGITEKQQLMKGLESLDPKKMLGAILNSSKASQYSNYYYRDSGQSQ